MSARQAALPVSAAPAAGPATGVRPASAWRRDARLALRLLAREWRAGELRVLVAALLVAVAGITSVGFFVDRVDRAMLSRASELLAADLLIASRDPIAERWAAMARSRGLATARTLTTRSVVLAGQNLRLTEVKAVTERYPLRGALRVADRPFGADRISTGIPAPGTAWVEGRLLAALGLAVGDSIELGAARLRVAQVLTYEPDRGGNLFSIAPRVLVNLEDIPKTALVQPGSRVQHGLLFAGARDAVSAWRTTLAAQLPDTFELQGVRDARPELRRALDRARQFLGLAALVGVMLAGAAIAVSAARHAERHLDAAALMRCFGASQRSLMRIYGLQLAVLALAGGLVGSALGFLAQYGLAALVGGLVVDSLPAPGPMPVLAGLAVAVATLGGFGVAPMLRLTGVPPARVLRRELAGLPVPAWGVYGAGLVALAAIAWWQAGQLQLAVMVLGGALGAVAVLALGAALLITVLGLSRGRLGPTVRFAVAGLTRRKRASVAQVVAFGLGIMALCLLALVRGELLDEWRNTLPADAPNFFLVNVQPDEVADLKAFMAANALNDAGLEPMIRGRLVAINDVPRGPEDYSDPRAQRLAARDFNLSYASVRPAHNPLLAGQWWATDAVTEISIEAGIGETLGFALGDSLRFSIAGFEVEGRITSVREVRWDSFRVNFFVIGSPGLLAEQPATFVTSFHLDPGRRDVLVELVRRHPSVTVIDVDALMGQVRAIMAHASLGIEYVFGFTVLAGLMVLLATIQSTLDERRYEGAVLRTLGASRGLLTRALLIEFAVLGALAGVLGAGAANLTASVVAERIFGFTLGLQPIVMVLGMLAGAGVVAAAGYLGTRSVLNRAPLQTLREAA